MEELLSLIDGVYKEYEIMERSDSLNFEKIQKSMEEIFVNKMKDLASKLTPIQTKKKVKRLVVTCCDKENISSGSEDIKTLRPVRTTRLNGIKKSKEISIENRKLQPVVKLWRKSYKENNINFTNQTLKSTNLLNKSTDELPLNDNNLTSQTINLNKIQTLKGVDCIESRTSENDNILENPNKKLDDFVVRKQSFSIKQEISEGESNKMPPPAIPEKKVTRTKKKKAIVLEENNTPMRITRSQIKRELIEELNSVIDTDSGGKRKLAIVGAEVGNESPANSSIESVYEDAKNDGSNMQQVIVLDQSGVENFSEKQKMSKLDATFTSSQSQNTAISTSFNDTFVVSSNSKENSTEKQASKCDETFFVSTNLSSNKGHAMITISNTEGSNTKNNITKPSNFIKPLTKASTVNATFIKPKNELFNPLMQSPVKKKIEAFEQATVESMQCQTLMKKKAKQDSILVPEQIKHSIQQNKKGGCLLSKNLITKPTLKLTHIQKTLKIHQEKFSSAIPQVSSNSATVTLENSGDKIKYGLSQKAIEDRCKKRKAKQQLAQQLRIAIDKEHREQTEKIIWEREDKANKILVEKEQRAKQKILKRQALKKQVDQKRLLEQINKNFCLQQKLQDEQRLENEMSENEYIETIKRENTAMEIIRLNQEKELLKLTLLKNKQKVAEHRELKKAKIHKYDFDNLESDDSTDEENKFTTKKPAPPSWSRPVVRQFMIEQQTYISCKLIDSFFSVAPMSPDLSDIFPQINPKCLRRNSSAVWNTPPRYTLLPKY